MTRRKVGALRKGGRSQKALMMQIFIDALRVASGQRPLYNQNPGRKKSEGDAKRGERPFMWTSWTFDDGNRRV